MITPLFFLGGGLTFCGGGLFLRSALKVLFGTRVIGSVIRIEEATDFGLSDSTHRVIIRYVDGRGKAKTVSTKPRATIGWCALEQDLPVYLFKNPNTPPFIGGFQEAWLFSLVMLGLGLLCFALGYV